MTKLSIISSIPPKFRGKSNALVEKRSILSRALETWKELGCEIFSAHTNEELSNYPSHQSDLQYSGVKLLLVEGSCIKKSSYLPNFQSMLRHAVDSASCDYIAIVNADIVIGKLSVLKFRLSTAEDKELLYGQRTDIDIDNDSFDPRKYIHGFDFFAISKKLLIKALPMVPQVLTFGLPWWDLYFPLAVKIAGGSLTEVPSEYFLHQIHSERWNYEAWLAMGIQADRELLESCKANPSNYPCSLQWIRSRKWCLNYASRLKFYLNSFRHFQRPTNKDFLCYRQRKIEICLRSFAGF